MDVASIAAALAAAQSAQTRLAVADKLIQISAQSDQAVVALLNSAQQNLANAAAGIGGQVNITA